MTLLRRISASLALTLSPAAWAGRSRSAAESCLASSSIAASKPPRPSISALCAVGQREGGVIVQCERERVVAPRIVGVSYGEPVINPGAPHAHECTTSALALTQGASTTTFGYDGDPTRIRKTTPTEETRYFRDLYERVTPTGSASSNRALAESIQ